MIELNKIYCGDCLEILKDVDNESIDLTLTSPPYKNSYEGIGINRGSKTAKYHYSNDVGEPLYIIQDFGKLLFDKLKSDGCFLLNLGYNKDSGALRPFYIVERLLKSGWFCPDKIIWHKKNPIPNTAYQLTNSFEYVFILTKQPTYKLKVGTRIYEHNIFNISINSEDNSHNAAFPLELPMKIIELFTNENDLVADFFNGSGTTTLASAKQNRKFIGVDINPKYCDIAEKRLQQETIFK